MRGTLRVQLEYHVLAIVEQLVGDMQERQDVAALVGENPDVG